VTALVQAGVEPVFVDSDLDTCNVSPQAVERALSPEICAIVATHNFGNPAPIKELQEIADNAGIPLILDAAHAFGSRYRGEPVGGQGRAQIFSLSPTKLVIGGEGGIIATNDGELAGKLAVGREYGMRPGYDCEFAGVNGRLAEFPALLAFKSLEMLGAAAANRNRLAELYRAELSVAPGVAFQRIHPDDYSVYKDMFLRINADEFGLTRDQLGRALTAENIDYRRYYDPPCNRQTAFKRYGSSGELRITEALSGSCLCVPMWSHMSEDTALMICRAIRAAHEHASEIRALFDR
jgi:dTDP-4-amino-4,6-dideoxygalactose transaminase